MLEGGWGYKVRQRGLMGLIGRETMYLEGARRSRDSVGIEMLMF